MPMSKYYLSYLIFLINSDVSSVRGPLIASNISFTRVCEFCSDIPYFCKTRPASSSFVFDTLSESCVKKKKIASRETQRKTDNVGLLKGILRRGNTAQTVVSRATSLRIPCVDLFLLLGQ